MTERRGEEGEPHMGARTRLLLAVRIAAGLLAAACSAAEGGMGPGAGGGGGTAGELPSVPLDCVNFESSMRPTCGGDPTGTWKGIRCARHLDPYEIELSYCALRGSAQCSEDGAASLSLNADGTGTYELAFVVGCTEVIPYACLEDGREREFCESWSAEDVEVGPFVGKGSVRCHLDADCICETETTMNYPGREIRYRVEGTNLVVEGWGGSVGFCATDTLLTLDLSVPGIGVAFEWLVREP